MVLNFVLCSENLVWLLQTETHIVKLRSRRRRKAQQTEPLDMKGTQTAAQTQLPGTVTLNSLFALPTKKQIIHMYEP
jgi:hypothetical protein